MMTGVSRLFGEGRRVLAFATTERNLVIVCTHYASEFAPATRPVSQETLLGIVNFE